MIPKMHSYQLVARDHLLANPGAGLFLDMGLGKTRITLEAIDPRKGKTLVVAPKRVCSMTWPTQTALWRPDLSLSLAAGTPAQRKAGLAAGADITVISRDNMAEAIGGPWATLVLDELSAWKVPGASRSVAARALAKRATTVWGLTGTPAPRSLDDLYHQVGLLDGGVRLGTSQERFRRRFYVPEVRLPGSALPPGAFITNQQKTLIQWTPKPGSEAEIAALISDICLSMGAVEGMVPPVTYNVVPLDLPAAQRKHYRSLVRDLLVEIDLIGTVWAANAAVVTNKLSQLTAGFLYDENRTALWLHDTKLDALEEVVEGAGSPVLTFYRYQAEATAIRQRFPEARGIDDPGALEGWMRGEVGMLLAHPASAGHGLNLQESGCHTVVWTSLDWSLELWLQANARIARQGQPSPVVIHTLEVTDSIDGIIAARLAGKDMTQDALLTSLRRQT